MYRIQCGVRRRARFLGPIFLASTHTLPSASSHEGLSCFVWLVLVYTLNTDGFKFGPRYNWNVFVFLVVAGYDITCSVELWSVILRQEDMLQTPLHRQPWLQRVLCTALGTCDVVF